MLNKKSIIQKFTTRLLAGAVTALIATQPAFAQIQKVNDGLTNLQLVLAGVAVTVVTIAVMWAGFKMVFQQSKWSDISNIFIGSMFIGSAAGFAAFFVG